MGVHPWNEWLKLVLEVTAGMYKLHMYAEAAVSSDYISVESQSELRSSSSSSSRSVLVLRDSKSALQRQGGRYEQYKR